LEKGKWADFIVLDQDIMLVENDKLLNTKVNATYINGKPVFRRK
jgi:predicted amidohydrolase YtcJ